MPDNNKVKFGLKKFCWWPITETTDSETGAVTSSYGAVHRVPGLVSIKLDRQAAQTIFRADDEDYYVYGGSRQLSGPVTFAEIPDDLAAYAFGDYRDDNGVLVSRSTATKRRTAISSQRFLLLADPSVRRQLRRATRRTSRPTS